MLFTGSLTTDCPIRQKIREFYRIDENVAVDHILPFAEVNVSARSRAWERARKMVLQIRQDQEGNGAIDALLNEYSLSSEEGVVLMCLAEALLRVPDKHTQDVLIRDKISQGQWSTHLGSSDSLFVNASSWGLLITGSMVDYADKRKQDKFGLLKKTIGRLGEPVIRKSMNYAMKIMGKQFVMGETIADATVRAAAKEQQGYVYSYDMLGEGARTMEDAERYLKSYQDAIEEIGKVATESGKNDPRRVPGISVKLSAIHPRYEFTHKSRVMDEIVPKLKALCLHAKAYNIGLTVDAEESERLDISLDIIEAVFTDTDLGEWQGFGIALQAYQKRALFVVDWLRELTLRANRRMMVRLVKGAYWDTEIKNSQKDGMSHFPVFTRKSSTDVSYHACANKLLDYRDSIYPQFATHNAYTAATIVELAGEDKNGFEFQCLHGMGDSLYDQIVSQEGIQCRIYAPVGHHEDLLAYLVRRLLENGANSSFVNAIVDESQPVESLLEDPVEKTQRLKDRYNGQIMMPIDLYRHENKKNENSLIESRDNSKGLDLTDISEITPLKIALDNWVVEFNRDKLEYFIKHYPSVSSEDETIAKIIKNRSSIARFGDGEFGIIKGRDINFQSGSREMSTRLEDILRSDVPQLLIALPDCFGDLDHFTPPVIAFWRKWLSRKRLWLYSFLDMKRVYASAFFTRPFISYKKTAEHYQSCGLYFEAVKEIWAGRDVIICEGEGTRFGIFNDLLADCGSVSRIICPARNAYDKYDEILSAFEEIDKDVLVLAALGPTATILSHDLCLLGYQTIDVGHLDVEYEWFLRKDEEGKPLENKYVDGSKEGRVVHVIDNPEYESQIIHRVL